MIITNSSEETINYAKSISDFFKPGNIYGLKGELASGKTTFIKGLLLGLNYKDMVNSPTFTLINEYNASHKVIHIDCYRETNLNRWVKIGFHDYINTENIVIIEWANKIIPLLPYDYIQIDFTHQGKDKRIIDLQN